MFDFDFKFTDNTQKNLEEFERKADLQPAENSWKTV